MEILGYLSYLPIVLDAILVIIFLVSIIVSARKGLVKSVYKILSVIITIVLVMTLVEPVSGVLEESQAGAMIYRSVSQQLNMNSAESEGEASKGVDVESVWDMPEYIKISGEITQAKESATSVATHTITGVIIRIIAVIALFVIIRLLLALVFLFLEGVVKLPVLKGLNAVAGVFASLISVLVTVYIVCAVISLDIPMFDSVKSIIPTTTVIRFFYDYNVLMSMFI